MDTVVLPLVTPGTPVADALEQLQFYHRAGVVRQDQGDTYRLLFAGDLLRARAAKHRSMGEVQGGHDILLIPPPTITYFNIDMVRPHRTRERYENMLDSQAASYALIAETPQQVVLVTRHETLAATLNMTGGFHCTGKPEHFFPEPAVIIRQQCPWYPECDRPDGRVPWVEPV